MTATDFSNSRFSFRQTMLVKHDHPSLSGHFPNNPIVPGVVILDQVMRLWQQKTNKHIQQINNTKFVSLLRADINYIIHYKEKNEKKIDFLIMDDNQTIIAKGLFSYV